MQSGLGCNLVCSLEQPAAKNSLHLKSTVSLQMHGVGETRRPGLWLYCLPGLVVTRVSRLDRICFQREFSC